MILRTEPGPAVQVGAHLCRDGKGSQEEPVCGQKRQCCEPAQQPRRTVFPWGGLQSPLAQKAPSLVSWGGNEEGEAVNRWLGHPRGEAALEGGTHSLPGSPALVGNVIFTQPHAPSDPSPTLALPQLFVLTLWFSFLTLLIETLEEKGKKPGCCGETGLAEGEDHDPGWS